MKIEAVKDVFPRLPAPRSTQLHLLGNIEPSEELSDVLVGALPGEPPCSHHACAVHLLRPGTGKQNVQY